MSQDFSQFKSALVVLETYVQEVRERVEDRTFLDGKLAADLADQQQRILHGYAWIVSIEMALKAVLAWAEKCHASGKFTNVERLYLDIAFGEYLAQIVGGLPMGQNEIVRPSDFGLQDSAGRLASEPGVRELLGTGNTPEKRQQLAETCQQGHFACEDFNDELIDAARRQYRRYVDESIIPFAHEWHLENALIPDDIVTELSELGTFGVCIPEEFGGLGEGKLLMSVVTEELSRGWISAGSLGTRSEIAGELISLGGTPEQKEYWLPKIASGEILPTAVFTEPDTGSDMGALSTRALSTGDGGWLIQGNKTWITHASRSDLMTLLARSKPEEKGYAGLSMFLVPKQLSLIHI